MFYRPPTSPQQDPGNLAPAEDKALLLGCTLEEGAVHNPEAAVHNLQEEVHNQEEVERIQSEVVHNQQGEVVHNLSEEVYNQQEVEHIHQADQDMVLVAEVVEVGLQCRRQCLVPPIPQDLQP